MAAGDLLRRLAQRAERMERAWPTDGAAIVERAVTGTLRSATGDGALSNGPRLGRATVTVRRRTGAATVEADGSMAVWAIIERGTKAHSIDAGEGRALATPYGPRRRVTVRGVRPKRAWSRGVNDARRDVEVSARRAFAEVVG